MVSIRRPSLLALRSAWVALLIAAPALPPVELHASPRDYVLQWIPPEGPVDGYLVHVGEGPARYEEVVDLGPVPIDPDGIGRATLTLDSTRDYYVALAAYNSWGDSPLSNEIVVPASACDPLACDDGEDCTADDCASGGCTHAPLPDGTSCDDGRRSTLDDRCVAGFCEGARKRDGGGRPK